jgi:putative hydrolase of the HAD superfamily
VFDFGGPVLLTPFELRHVGEDALGLPSGALTWTGPFDPDTDVDWQSFQSGEITERDYWDLQVARFAELTGLPAEMPVMMGYLYSGTQEQLVRPGALELIRDAQHAGRAVGMLTNDLTAFHDQEWIDRMTVIGEFDAMVDGRSDGVLKPDPAAYLLMCERLGVRPADVVFIDDQPVNLAGAQTVGLQCVHLDPTNPEPGFAAARALLHLPA